MRSESVGYIFATKALRFLKETHHCIVLLFLEAHGSVGVRISMTRQRVFFLPK